MQRWLKIFGILVSLLFVGASALLAPSCGRNDAGGDIRLAPSSAGYETSPYSVVGDTSKSALAPRMDKPVSKPGAFPTEGGVPIKVHLFDAGSFDPDGEIVKWEWNFGDQEEGEGGWHDFTATRGDAWHTYTHPGTIVAHLRVTDNDGNTDVAFVKIKLSEEGNANPVAVANADPLFGTAPLTVHFSAEGSYDPDGTIVKWEWDFGDGVFQDFTPTQGVAEYTYTTGGLYTAILRVTDDDGASAMASKEIDVNEPPVAVANADPTTGNAPLTVNFSATGSHDPDGSIVKYEWDFGEGTGWHDYTSTQGVAEFTYAEAGTYTAMLRVTDDRLAADTASVNIEAKQNMRGDWWMFGREPTHKRRSPFLGPQSGRVKWKFKARGRVISSPAIASDGTIYIGNHVSDGWYYFYAINPDGSEKWKVSTPSVASGPAIGVDGTVYVGASRYLYAFAPTGAVKWRYETEGAITSSPAIADDGTVYIGVEKGYFYAFRPDGTVKWKLLLGTGNQSEWFHSSPAIAQDGTVYVGTRGRSAFFAIDPAGFVRWQFSTSWGAFDSSPAIALDGTIYVGNNNGTFYAFNPDGSVKWQYYATGDVVESPAVGADGTVYVTTYGGYVFAFSPEGELKWRYATDYGGGSAPAIGGDGTIYVGRGTYMYAISSEGTLKWLFQCGGFIQSSPAIAEDGTLYVGSWDDFLYAFHSAQPSMPPVAQLSAFPTSGPLPLTVNYDASDSFDPDGTIIKFEWDWDGNGSWDYDSGSSARVVHTFYMFGTYISTVRVTDYEGLVSTAVVKVDTREQPNGGRGYWLMFGR